MTKAPDQAVERSSPLQNGVATVLLTESNLRFWGFEDLRWARIAARKTSLYDREPICTIIDDGIFVPATPFVGDGNHGLQSLGGVLDSRGVPVPSANLRRHGSVMFAGIPDALGETIHAEQTLDEEIICAGWLLDQYGHFLLESLARTWFLPEVDPTMRVAFHGTRRASPRGTARRALELFGIPQERMIVLDAPTRVRRMHVPQPLYELGFAAHVRAAEPFRAVADRIVGTSYPTLSRQPVYLSRHLLDSDRREVVGEDELEALLRDNGFLIVHPEKMAFEDQVRLFNGHTDYFACEGSATHGALFARQQPRIHLLVPTLVTPDHVLVSRVVGTSVTFVRCLDTSRNVTTTRQNPELVDLGQVANYLEGCGLLRRRLRATLAERAAALADRYEEACLAAQIDGARARGVVMADADLKRANARSEVSWRICWHLLRYYAVHDPVCVESFAEHFMTLVSRERDTDLLAKFNRQIGRKPTVTLMSVLPHLSHDTRERLLGVLREWFPQ